MRFVLFMPWAMIGALGCMARNSFHTEGCRPGNSAFKTMVSGTSISLNSRPTRALPHSIEYWRKSLVHEIRAAACQVRAEDRALAKAELFNEKREADSYLSVGRPG